MAISDKHPGELAERLARRAKFVGERPTSDGWRRDSFTLPRDKAREKASEFFNTFPKAAYMTEIESWRELADGSIEFTMRRLPSAD
jgi:hypothetical protein